MAKAQYDVAGIGNAIVDIIGRCDDSFLAQNGAPKGSMRLVDDATASALYQAMGPAVEISGGSAANSMAGIASFGGKAAFIGKVACDEFGRIFSHDLCGCGVAFNGEPAALPAATSRSLILVTPDGERTMNTFLGVSTDLDGDSIDPGLIKNADIVYLEGYLFDRPAAKSAFHKAADIAAGAGRRVALTLSDQFCVDRHRTEFLTLIDDRIDILFANEKEILSLYETDSFEGAVRQASMNVKLAVITRSEKGSIILFDGSHLEVPAAKVDKVVDTTGAGDLYAAGFLYGLTQGTDLETAGRLGSLAAAEIISHIGARPEINLNRFARERGLIVT